MLTLYVGTKHLSSWSLRPFLALAHVNAEFTCTTIPLYGPSTRADILAVSPTGKVPCLVEQIPGAPDLVIPDSLAICEYVAEQYPALWPADRATRARARAVSAEMHAGFAAIRQDMPMQILADKPGVGHTPEALADADRLKAIWTEALARSGGPFLFGAFSIADCMFAPVTTRFTTYGVPLTAPLRAYCEAVQATPAFQRWKREAIAELTAA